MADELERLQIVIEADASGVAPATQAAGNAVEQFGRRASTATRAATEAVKRYKEAFREAQKSARLDAQKSALGVEMQKTNIAYEQSARAMRAYRAEVDRYKRVGQEGSTRGIAAAAKEEAEAMRLAQLETKGAAQAQRYASLEEQQRVQSQIASAAADRKSVV